MHNSSVSNMTCGGSRSIIQGMSNHRKPIRSAAEKARDTAAIIGSMRHEGYAPTADEEAIHQRVASGEITRDQAKAIFLEQARAIDATLLNPRRRTQRT